MKKQLLSIFTLSIFSILILNAQVDPGLQCDVGIPIINGGEGNLKLMMVDPSGVSASDQALHLDNYDIQTKTDTFFTCGNLYIQDQGGNTYVGSSGYLTRIGSNFLIDDSLSIRGVLQERASSEIAFGTIAASGGVLSSSGNIAVTYDPLTNAYEIQILGETYNTTEFTTVATPIGVFGVPVTNSSPSGNLLIELYSPTTAGTVQGSFSFVVHRQKFVNFEPFPCGDPDIGVGIRSSRR